MLLGQGQCLQFALRNKKAMSVETLAAEQDAGALFITGMCTKEVEIV